MAIIYTNQSSGYSRKNRKKMNSLSTNQIAEYKEDLRKHNKHYKSKGLHSMLMTLDEYIKYTMITVIMILGPFTAVRVAKSAEVWTTLLAAIIVIPAFCPNAPTC